MRILTLSNTPLDESLGSGYVVSGYARRLRERGHQVDLLGPSDYEPLHPLRRAIRYRQTIGMAAASLRRVGDGYDVIEIYGGEGWLAISALARLPARRFLLVSHSNGLETHCAERLDAAPEGRAARRWYHLGHDRWMARGFRLADAIVTVAPFDRAYALREGYAGEGQVLAIENPLPEPFLGREIRLAREPIVGYCGAWLPIKGTALMARDLPRLLQELPAWRLMLVGVGAGFRPENWFPADVLPRVSVVPRAARETELPALYERFAITILPSYYESFGLAAAEAMACGSALIATRVGFAAGLCDGEEALLLPAAASPHLYEALRTLIEDPGRRERIARAGHRRVQALSWESAVSRLEEAYAGWLGEFRRSAAA
jgi:glycosyltransferase involved in cell wall biosynthesis